MQDFEIKPSEIAEAAEPEPPRTWAALAKARATQRAAGAPSTGAGRGAELATAQARVADLWRSSTIAAGCFLAAALSYAAGYFHGLETTRSYLEQSQPSLAAAAPSDGAMAEPSDGATAEPTPLPIPAGDLAPVAEPPAAEPAMLAALPAEAQPPARRAVRRAVAAYAPPDKPREQTRAEAPRANRSAASGAHLQVAAFRNEVYAEALRQRLTKLGFRTLVRPAANHLQVVYVGPFPDETTARAAAARLQAAGLQTILRRF